MFSNQFMKFGVTIVTVFILLIALFLLLNCDFRILSKRGKIEILNGAGIAELAGYQNEFISQIQISGGIHALDKISVGFDEPYSYLPFFRTNDEWSSDHRMKINIKDEDLNHREYHSIIVSTNSSDVGRVIFTAREADPGSGLSFSAAWSEDSKAIFIYGGGTPIGYKDIHTISLIYLTEQNKLYSIDRLTILKKKRDQLTNETSIKENALPH